MMRENFLQQFDSNMRQHITSFAQRLSSISQEVDVMIFLARKAACLGDCFTRLGFSTFSCTVTSSRILDLNLNWLRNKKIAIIDDMLISGTTLNRAIEKLRKNGISNVKVYVLSTDKDFFNAEVVQVESPHLCLPNNQIICTCSEIVKAISSTARPYTIDYPLYRDCSLSEKSFAYILTTPGWITFDTTPFWLLQNGIINITITPDKEKAKSFLHRIGLQVSSDVLLKLRLYAKKSGQTLQFSIQPIVILPELMINDLNNLFELANKQLRPLDFTKWNLETEKDDTLQSRLRLIQYILASQLTQFWYTDLSVYRNPEFSLKQCKNNIRLLFPNEIMEAIYKACDVNKLHFNNYLIPSAVDQPIVTTQNARKKLFDDIVAAYKLTSPFIEKYKREELKARMLVKNMGLNAFKDEKYKNTLQRLNRGFSIDDLKHTISEYAGTVDISCIISNFLDIYIDRGSIVPITHISGDKIYRAFRHGEDVQFSHEELSLFALMLHYATGNNNSLKATYLEKLLVLFARSGVQQRFLQLTYGSDAVGIHYYLHGAMLQQSSSTRPKYSFTQSDSVRSILEHAGYIKYCPKMKGFITSEPPIDGTGKLNRAKATKFGRVMNKLIYDNSKESLSSEDFAFLATCPSLIDLIGALAAELNIFTSRCYPSIRAVLRLDYTKVTLDNIVKIRKQTAFTALNSGTWKFTSFKRGKYATLLKKAHNFLLKTDALYADEWDDFFPTVISQESHQSPHPELNDLANELVTTLYFLRACINYVELSLSRNWASFSSTKAYKELNDIVSELEENIPTAGLRTHINTVLREAKINILDKKNLYEYVCKHITELKSKGHFGDLLARANVITSNCYAIDKMEIFRHFLYINWGDCSPETKNAIMSRIADFCKGEVAIISERQMQQSPQLGLGMWLCFTPDQIELLSQLVIFLTDCTTSGANRLIFSFILKAPSLLLMRNAYSSDFKSDIFWNVSKTLPITQAKLPNQFEIHVFTSLSDIAANTLKRELIKHLSKDFMIHSRKSCFSYKLEPYTYNAEEILMTKHQQIATEHSCDVGIICIKAEELAGIKGVLSELTPIEGKNSARLFYHSWLHNSIKQELSVIITRTISQGNQSIITAYNDLTTDFSPQYIVLLGIAGGITQKTKIGDVVIANHVLGYEPAAETEQGLMPKPNMYELQASSKVLLQSLQNANEHDDMKFSAIDPKKQEMHDFTCYIADIASGEKVLKDKNGKSRKYIESVSSNIYAVETEATGFSVAFNEQELSPINKPKGIFIIRGISDLADVAKSDEHQILASRHAMHVLKELCAANEIQPVNKPIS